MKKYAFSEFVMCRWKQIVIFTLSCVIGFSTDVFAETTLIIVTGEIPPMISEQPENSFLTEIFQEVGKEMDVKFVFQFLPWKRCELYITELKAWGAIPYVKTPEREQIFDFSERLVNATSKLFGYSSDEKMRNISYTELNELKKYRIGGVRGYWYEKMFQDAGIKLDIVTNEEQNIKKLQAGRIHFAPMNETPGWHMIGKLFPEESGKFFTLTKPLRAKDNFLMTSKQYPNGQELLTRFNAALKKIKQNGVFQKIADKRGMKVAY